MRYIYCHPLFDERKCAHRFSYEIAKIFEKNNLQLERFDYRGTGEAEGAFCDVTMDSLRGDLKRIINGGRVCLIGTRFGAALVYDYCRTENACVETAVLIEPVVNGKSYTDYLFRKQYLKDMMTGNSGCLLPQNGFCNLEGYKAGSKFIEQIREVSLTETADSIKIGKAVHIVQISASSRVNTEYSLFSERLKKSGINASIEIFNLPAFWERIPDGDYSIVTEKIAEWCRWTG